MIGLSIVAGIQESSFQAKTGTTAVSSQTTGCSDNAVFTPTTSSTVKGDELDLNNESRTLEEELRASYEGYDNSTEEEKQELTVKYFRSRERSRKSGNELEQFNMYRRKCKDNKEYERLTGCISKMDSKYQLSAAKEVINEENQERRKIGQRSVARDYHKYDRKVQTETSKLIAKTADKEVIKEAASHASQCDKENQVEIVQQYYQDIKPNEVSNEKNTQLKREINKTLIDQYGKYDKENQLDIHRIMAYSKDSETAEYAAKNIYQFDKENQAEGVKITTDTGNQKAINAAASQWSKYDESAKAQIKQYIQTSNSDEAKETLKAEEAKLEAQKEEEQRLEEEEEEQKVAEEKAKEEKANNSASALTQKKVKQISSQNNISAKDIRFVNGNTDKATLDTLAKKAAQSFMAITIYGKEIGNFDSNVQIALIANAPDLKLINRNNLSLVARKYYDERLKETSQSA